MAWFCSGRWRRYVLDVSWIQLPPLFPERLDCRHDYPLLTVVNVLRAASARWLEADSPNARPTSRRGVTRRSISRLPRLKHRKKRHCANSSITGLAKSSSVSSKTAQRWLTGWRSTQSRTQVVVRKRCDQPVPAALTSGLQTDHLARTAFLAGCLWSLAVSVVY